MNSKIYWIDGPWPGKLAISSRPRGGDWIEGEVALWRRAGVDVVVSLLTRQENEELELGAEPGITRALGLRFVSLPVEDRSVPPSWDDALHVVANIGEMLQQGRNVAVHCRQGIGRSGMIAAAILIKDGMTPDAALHRISEARGLPVPETPEQQEWVRTFAAREATSAPSSNRASVK